MLLPTSTKLSLLQTLVVGDWPVVPEGLWGCLAAELGICCLTELGRDAVGTSAVTKRVMMHVGEEACDG